MNRIGVALLCFLFLVFPCHPAFAGDQDRPRIGGSLDESHADLTGAIAGWDTGNAVSTTARVRLLRLLVPACQGNLAAARRNLGALCDQARQVCVSTPEPDDIGYWVYTAPAGPPAPTAADWTSDGRVVCRGGVVDGEEPEPVVTADDFRRLPIPAAGLRIQPADRRTLVNVPTNLYAESEAAVLPTTILGFPIRVRATPSRFHWRYGDGRALATRNAGGPYPRLDTAHTYAEPGQRTVTLATEYTGEYSVDGGPWQPIDGTANVTSPNIRLTVEEARAHLVS